ncbi:MAG: DUF1428 family protein [Puniceicoccaceae bacterium]|nr:MAG: DUF1428 family protein [Puniceicoccaceae bacterium]
MSKYIDGFVIPVPTAKMPEYKRIAALASKVWKEHGALEYIEAAGDDFPVCGDGGKPAPELIGASGEETIIFSYIVYESREHRDTVNGKVIEDPRMNEICPAVNGVFDFKRMIYGGFRVIVDA